MNKRPKYIDLSPKKIKEIAEIKEVSLPTVYAALNYQTNSTLALLIRSWALNNGGVEYVLQENKQKVKVI